MYETKMTTQGTITLPAELRKEYKLVPGDIIPITKDGKLLLSKGMSLKEVQEMNRKILKEKRLWGKKFSYKQGDGMAIHVLEKYGKK